MDDPATRVLERLDRIEALDRARAPAAMLIDELRQLVLDAEQWAKREGDGRAGAAVQRLRREAEGMR